jgi:hypothetical protein
MTSSRDLSLRHTLATLSYRAAKVLRGAPQGFSGFRAGETSRSAGEILCHVCDLLDWALSQASGHERWQDTHAQGWDADVERFFRALKAFDDYLASDAELHAKPEKMFQGAVADAFTHVGQIALLRRLAGSRIRGENYYKAAIEVGRIGTGQAPATVEFD